MSQSTTISLEEQARRRKIMLDALANARLEGLEPDPIVFTYIERYVRGEMTLADAIADYTARLDAIKRYTAQQQDLLRDFAARYIWWKTVQEALLFPERVVAQVMNMGIFEDLVRLSNAWTIDELRQVVNHAEPGWFNERSWAFWHLRLGLTANTDSLPPLPVRSFPD